MPGIELDAALRSMVWGCPDESHLAIALDPKLQGDADGLLLNIGGIDGYSIIVRWNARLWPRVAAPLNVCDLPSLSPLACRLINQDQLPETVNMYVQRVDEQGVDESDDQVFEWGTVSRSDQAMWREIRVGPGQSVVDVGNWPIGVYYLVAVSAPFDGIRGMAKFKHDGSVRDLQVHCSPRIRITMNTIPNGAEVHNVRLYWVARDEGAGAGVIQPEDMWQGECVFDQLRDEEIVECSGWMELPTALQEEPRAMRMCAKADGWQDASGTCIRTGECEYECVDLTLKKK
jgi:hypothetical protein